MEGLRQQQIRKLNSPQASLWAVLVCDIGGDCGVVISLWTVVGCVSISMSPFEFLDKLFARALESLLGPLIQDYAAPISCVDLVEI